MKLRVMIRVVVVGLFLGAAGPGLAARGYVPDAPKFTQIVNDADCPYKISPDLAHGRSLVDWKLPPTATQTFVATDLSKLGNYADFAHRKDKENLHMAYRYGHVLEYEAGETFAVLRCMVVKSGDGHIFPALELRAKSHTTDVDGNPVTFWTFVRALLESLPNADDILEASMNEFVKTDDYEQLAEIFAPKAAPKTPNVEGAAEATLDKK